VGRGHPEPRAHEIVNQGIRLHGISTWRTDRQQFESRTKQIKALAFKRCPVPFLVRESVAVRRFPTASSSKVIMWPGGSVWGAGAWGRSGRG